MDPWQWYSIFLQVCFFAMGAGLNTLRVYFRQEGGRRVSPRMRVSGRHLRTFVSIERPMPVTKKLRRDTFLKEVQLSFWKCKQSRAAIETDRQFWKSQEAGLIKSF
jgi:hypothetical protein